MAEEFYLLKVGNVWFTDDGTGTGAPCLTKVDGLASLFLAHIGATVKPMSGSPKNFIAQNSGKGVDLITKPFVVTETVLNALKALIDAANAGNTDIAVEVSDGPGAANVNCKPLFEGGIPPLNFGPNFYDTDLYDVELRLVTNGFTTP